MYADGTMRCGVEGCKCQKYNEGKDEKAFSKCDVYVVIQE